jgi:hypothetical protein
METAETARTSFPNRGSGERTLAQSGAPNVWAVAIPFLDELRAWYETYLAAGGRRDVRGVARRSPRAQASGVDRGGWPERFRSTDVVGIGRV